MKFFLLTAAFALSLLTAWQSTANQSTDRASTVAPATPVAPVARPSS